MRIKTGDLWELAFSQARVRRRSLQGTLDSVYPGFNAMDTFEKKIVRKAGIRLTGERLFELLLEGGNVQSQGVQDEIDEHSVEFIAAYSGISATDTWGNFANIPGMPETTLLQSDLNELNRIASIMLPGLWTEMPPVIDSQWTDNQKEAVY